MYITKSLPVVLYQYINIERLSGNTAPSKTPIQYIMLKNTTIFPLYLLSLCWYELVLLYH